MAVIVIWVQAGIPETIRAKGIDHGRQKGGFDSDRSEEVEDRPVTWTSLMTSWIPSATGRTATTTFPGLSSVLSWVSLPVIVSNTCEILFPLHL